MICISIAEKNIDKCSELINTADLAEIRIDMAGFDESEVQFLFSKSSKPLIATCRPEFVSDSERIKLLKAAIDSGAAFVDIEIETNFEIRNDLVRFAKKKNCKVIISYHNFKNTPDTEKLHEIIESCFEAGADIVKIATNVLTKGESSRILGLYDKYKSLIAIGMGEAGKITRVAGMYLGSPFTFASVSEKEKTAPGQMTVNEMKSLLNIL